MKQTQNFAVDTFEPRKRTALDGRVWWVPYNVTVNAWNTFTVWGKYRTRKACAFSIRYAKENYA